MRQPSWMAEAWAELGQRERAGDASNPRVARMLAEVGHRGLGDDTPWCAAFVGACLERAGHASTLSLRARSYLEWGVPAAAEFGTIVVLSRGADPSLGHVGFLVGESGERLYVLGGNQSDAVTVAPFDRGRVLGFREPATARATDGAMSSNFESVLAHVLEMEGGWSNDPHDPGGPTNRGITLAVYASFSGATLRADNREQLIAELRTIPDRVVREIYLRRYWKPARCSALPAALALMHFDAAVNQGVGTAARMLQEALDVETDGEIGPLTLGAARAVPVREAVETYADIRRRRYRAIPHFWRFGRGWLRRVDMTEAAALAASTSPSPRRTSVPSQTKETPPMSDTNPFPTPPSRTQELDGKWWGHSMTVWGALITAATTVLPLVGSALGLDLTPDLIERLGQDLVVLTQAIGGLIGTAVTIIGRARASTALSRRPVRLQL